MFVSIFYLKYYREDNIRMDTYMIFFKKKDTHNNIRKKGEWGSFDWLILVIHQE
ncbi:hypothetical protein Bbu156a_J05 (plasmid) [Borreliella burgdorferi 156a]|nr:hypothetical protein Bbu156a_J05 [Borreliella burgdorferi 156a]